MVITNVVNYDISPSGYDCDAIVHESCMDERTDGFATIDYGIETRLGKESRSVQQHRVKKINHRIDLRDDMVVGTKNNNDSSHNGIELWNGYHNRTEMLIFRRLSESISGIVSRFTCPSVDDSDTRPSLEKRDNRSSFLRDEDFYWPSSSNSYDTYDVTNSRGCVTVSASGDSSDQLAKQKKSHSVPFEGPED